MDTYTRLSLALWAAGVPVVWWQGLYSGLGWFGTSVLTLIIGMAAGIVSAAVTGNIARLFGWRP